MEKSDVFIRDTSKGVTHRVSMRDASTQTTDSSYYSIVSGDGSTVIFLSSDQGLVSGDTNGVEDIFAAETGLEDCSI